jgi:tetratricopeptide (TPR) repeat protein
MMAGLPETEAIRQLLMLSLGAIMTDPQVLVERETVRNVSRAIMVEGAAKSFSGAARRDGSAQDVQYPLALTYNDEDMRQAFLLSLFPSENNGLAFMSERLKARPDYLPLRTFRARVYASRHMYVEAERDIEKALSLDPHDADVLFFRCRLQAGRDYGHRDAAGHRACFKEVADAIKADKKQEGKPLIDAPDGCLYLAAATLAGLPEAESLRREYIRYLSELMGETPDFVERYVLMPFDDKTLIPDLSDKPGSDNADPDALPPGHQRIHVPFGNGTGR